MLEGAPWWLVAIAAVFALTQCWTVYVEHRWPRPNEKDEDKP